MKACAFLFLSVFWRLRFIGAEKKESAAPVPVRSAPNGKTSVAATAEPSNAPVITCAPEQAATPVLLDALQDTREPETVRSLSITPKADVSESSISRTFDQPVESKSEENESQRQLSAGAGNTTSPQSMSPPPPVLNVPEGFFDGLMSGRDPEKILVRFVTVMCAETFISSYQSFDLNILTQLHTNTNTHTRTHTLLRCKSYVVGLADRFFFCISATCKLLCRTRFAKGIPSSRVLFSRPLDLVKIGFFSNGSHFRGN